MSFSPYIGNKKKEDSLILGKGPMQGVEHTWTAKNCIQLTLLNKIRNFL